MSTLYQVIQEGLDASKPTPGINGRLYFTTDTKLIYYDNGSSWVNVGPTGSGSGSGALTQIAQTVVSGTTTNSVSFSSIAATYTQLRLVLNVNSSDTSADALRLQFNGDTGANYDYNSVYMSGVSSLGVASSLAQTAIVLSGGTPTVASRSLSLVCDIPSYAGTAFYKNLMFGSQGLSGTAYLQNVNGGGAWRNTSAINSIDLFFASGDSFLAGSTITLYGIK